MRIAIFGGSFNPPHIGHIHAASTILSELNPDRLYIIPAGIPPHKALASGASNEDRLELARLAFQNLDKRIIISDIEIHKEKPCYTVETLEFFRNQFPDDEIFLYVGDDMFLSFDKWKDYKRILSLCRLFVMQRNENVLGMDRMKSFLEGEGGDIILSEISPIEMSSTDIRNNIESEKLFDMVTPDIAEYIKERGLYQNV